MVKERWGVQMDSSNPELNADQGFVKKKYASKKIIRGPDGTPQIVFVDTSTGQVLKNSKGYTVIEQSNVVDPSQQQRSQVSVSKGQTVEDPKNQMTNEVRGIPETHDNANVAAAKETGEKTVASNSYGYTNKPMGMGFLGFLPQPLGLAATATNVGINAANTEAVNDQREALGFSENPMSKQIGSSLFDKQGYIGDQTTIDQTGVTRTTPVGFEATDPVGRTTLTPEEARKREALNPEGYNEASQAAIENAREKFAAENPGWGQSLANAAGNLFGGLFGSPSNTAASMAGKPGAGSGNSSSFPDRPSPPANTSAGLDTSRGPQTDTSGYSPGLW
jgi:hypothetical protein